MSLAWPAIDPNLLLVITLRLIMCEPPVLDHVSKNIPSFLEYNVDKLEGKVVGECAREEVGIPLEEHLIVELYSK